jgi:nucleoside-diphosphate-sugar epimerase
MSSSDIKEVLMRIFVTGASGWIASAVIPELLAAGHQVLGLARSDAAAAKVAALGADVQRGDLNDLEGLRAAAAASDGVVHLGYNHDFSQMGAAAETDGAVIDAFGEVLAGSDRPLLIASGVLGVASGRTATENDQPDAAAHPRVANAAKTLALAGRGVRSIVVRFAPTVHGEGDYGFTRLLTGIARAKGVSAYVGDGANVWPAVHRLDAGALVARAIDRAPAGSNVHATAEEGVPAREIAEAIGRSLDLPVKAIPADQAVDHFGWLGPIFAADCPTSSARTQEQLDWHPTHNTLIADIDAGYYAASGEVAA